MSSTLEDKQAELKGAIQELDRWEEYDSRREDGSGAQARIVGTKKEVNHCANALQG